MNRLTWTLTTLLALGVAANQPSARGDTPIGGPIAFTYGATNAAWHGNVYEANHHHHQHGYYGGYGGYGGYGYGPVVVPAPYWTRPRVVVPYVAPPTAVYPDLYGCPGYYSYGSPYNFQYYGPRFSLGLSF